MTSSKITLIFTCHKKPRDNNFAFKKHLTRSKIHIFYLIAANINQTEIITNSVLHKTNPWHSNELNSYFYGFSKSERTQKKPTKSSHRAETPSRLKTTKSWHRVETPSRQKIEKKQVPQQNLLSPHTESKHRVDNKIDKRCFCTFFSIFGFIDPFSRRVETPSRLKIYKTY